MSSDRGALLAARLPIPPLPYTHAKGSWIYGEDGRRYLDAASGLICVNLGHGHPRIVEALADQARKAAFAPAGTLSPVLQERLATATALAVDRPDDRVVFTSTGTAGIEMAIALARVAQRVRGNARRSRILTATLSYHGNSAYALALSGHRRRRPHPDDSFGIAPAFNPPYPGQHENCPYPMCRSECASAVADAIDEAGPDTVAAVLLEPVNGSTGGAYRPPDGYLARVREICDERGVLLLYDEVLTGLGRTGLPLAADHAAGADPDIVVVSKGLGAGYVAVAAVLIAPDMAADIEAARVPTPLMGTMAATPLQARVGLAVLAELDELGALDRTKVRGGFVGDAVDAAVRGLPVVRDRRGVGYFHGIELADGLQGEAMRTARRHGLLLYPFNGYRPDGGGEGVIVAPPLNTSPAEADHLSGALRAALLELIP
jgi:taurine---2-oxoglutarate transaminase